MGRYLREKVHVLPYNALVCFITHTAPYRACLPGLAVSFGVHRFVVWANIAAACEGVRRRVGELTGSVEVVQVFSHLHKEFFK